MRAKVFFCHIPKCMGTTVFDFLQSRYKIVCSHDMLNDLDFPEMAWNVHYSMSKVNLCDISNKWKIADRFNDIDIDVVHGHIPMSILDGSIPEAKRITFVREPVERVISHYEYYRQHGIRGCRNITLAEFAVRECNINVMSLFLDNASPDFVGFTHIGNAELDRLADFLGVARPNSKPVLNKTTIHIQVTQDDVDLIAELNAKDIELYKSLLSMYNGSGG